MIWITHLDFNFHPCEITMVQTLKGRYLGSCLYIVYYWKNVTYYILDYEIMWLMCWWYNCRLYRILRSELFEDDGPYKIFRSNSLQGCYFYLNVTFLPLFAQLVLLVHFGLLLRNVFFFDWLMDVFP